ncbi:hypothetical protein A3I99_03580 [Candidatus Kaiserbacteria bacterium RIFCSPLOWO2_02_FULL_45_11b]|uniref:Uncharacterized protein n=1 Tax=Candidatus Kaiserbacteria bacterium RIFCSPLOWO2_12_FULL_45_26 TaxID=1798525 RepID=A0A1F6FH33_9BACT|nr:MAG: hypothetical protein A2929_02545 [Candidatus Kaiserbacteria bacterium RIFCSPLOWO2_01_FULL_45_25]OGG83673.1 MAG: hypothetical protein A3I99_03580 [Candidatus Kaiserbacteria bacterium RIFCSPLOWO2_02_FULL_45_11b]OGG85165.1 MAG: hypothetical protein A3G90_03865 [Candidatus Kaiserbacteria bacterium RIFCSPLOWO2_12_FULL_45_26]
MEIIILLLITGVAVFIIRALVNNEWRKSAQEKIDSIRKERIFWRLINGYGGFVFGVEAIFTICLDPKRFTTYMTDSQQLSVADKKVLRLLKKNRGIGNINIINTELKKVEESISSVLSDSSKILSKSELETVFDARNKDNFLATPQHEKLVDIFLLLLTTNSKVRKIDIWKARKLLDEEATRLEWKNEEEKVDTETLFYLKKSNVDIGETVADILIVEAPSDLKEMLKEWELMRMIKSSIVDYAVRQIGMNRIQHFGWKLIAEVAG